MRIWIARPPGRGALYLPMGATRRNPSLMFFLPQGKGKLIGEGQLDEMIRSNLARQGVTKESDVNALITKAEADYEERIHVAEAHQEAKRLMAIRAAGGSLIQAGFRKWRQAFFPAVKRLVKGGA